jgi:FMN reductase
VAVVLTGASHHHFLAVDGLRDVLAGFFAVQVVSPSLFDDAAYSSDGQLDGDSRKTEAGTARRWGTRPLQSKVSAALPRSDAGSDSDEDLLCERFDPVRLARILA